MIKKFLLSAFFCSSLCAPLLAQQFWIVGGTNAQEGQFPWIGDMRVSDGHQCGSALIGAEWVLTAGHCAFGTNPNQPMDTGMVSLRFNTVNTFGQLNPNGGVMRKVDRIYVHPDFDFSNFSNGNDLCLYHLSEPVTSIEPIQLPTSNDTVLYQTGQFTNWQDGV